eukprot:TRINITY_DN2942_c0_g1_i1.p2 TRINITY_DN2942_c0_g1~~TRINITY_DN2942_c0_g1_i1.p2  ORF type:complete len:121 (+),score=29.65 TRINITY_DN2942_c0_g1_i1:24-365(+)
MSTKVIHAHTEAEFDTAVKNAGSKPVVIDFSAAWCGPCKMIAPKFDSLSTEYDGKVVFIHLDVDEVRTVSAKYGVSAMPTFVFLKDGKKLENLGFSGASPQKLAANIELASKE